jgi:hypothetical protein
MDRTTAYCDMKRCEYWEFGVYNGRCVPCNERIVHNVAPMNVGGISPKYFKPTEPF